MNSTSIVAAAVNSVVMVVAALLIVVHLRQAKNYYGYNNWRKKGIGRPKLGQHELVNCLDTERERLQFI